MNTLMQRPSRNGSLGLLGDDFDNLFEGFFRPMRRVEPGQTMAIPLDIVERENEYVIRAEIPGVDKSALDITLTDGILTIAAQSVRDEEKAGERLVRQERAYGKYSRSVQLGSQIDEKNVKANYTDGILELVLAKAEEVRPRKIAVS